VRVAEIDTERLLHLQERINIYFKRRRDCGMPTDIIYGNLKMIENELSRRRVRWSAVKQKLSPRTALAK
jgi:hypothetical protein